MIEGDAFYLVGMVGLTIMLACTLMKAWRRG